MPCMIKFALTLQCDIIASVELRNYTCLAALSYTPFAAAPLLAYYPPPLCLPTLHGLHTLPAFRYEACNKLLPCGSSSTSGLPFYYVPSALWLSEFKSLVLLFNRCLKRKIRLICLLYHFHQMYRAGKYYMLCFRYLYLPCRHGLHCGCLTEMGTEVRVRVRVVVVVVRKREAGRPQLCNAPPTPFT
jgi:hypothetical protein